MSRSILFVDDEVNIIMGLKRSLRGLTRDWELYFASSGQEALQILAEHPIDVIITDIRMPGMDGGELLEIVSERYPQVIRFVLSGQSDQEMALKSSRVAHQFIAKPCETRILVQTIQHSLELRELQTNPALTRIITSIKKLPSLPSLYLQLVQEMESPDAALKKIAAIISQDITMTAKTLQLVNSAFYGLSSKVTNLQQAVTILGINTLKSLTLYSGVFSEFESTPNRFISIDKLWDHSIGVGTLARQIVRLEGGTTQMQDDAQVAGVMHDIGKLIQMRVPDFYETYTQKVYAGTPPLRAEYEILGTSHAELGAYLLGIWGLPDPVVQAVAYHHMPSRQSPASFSALTAVHIANVFWLIKPETAAEEAPKYLDNAHLQPLNLLDKVKFWAEMYRKLCGLN